VTFDFPYPPRDVSPNARKHWRVKAKATAAYRRDCYVTALAYGAQYLRAKLGEGKIDLRVCVSHPDRRRRDDDNAYSSFKSGRDGLADALGVDDNRFRTTYEVADDPCPGGRVRVTLA
jgi:crossover junction endodeoxyribonuclease RusA